MLARLKKWLRRRPGPVFIVHTAARIDERELLRALERAQGRARRFGTGA